MSNDVNAQTGSTPESPKAKELHEKIWAFLKSPQKLLRKLTAGMKEEGVVRIIAYLLALKEVFDQVMSGFTGDSRVTMDRIELIISELAKYNTKAFHKAEELVGKGWKDAAKYFNKEFNLTGDQEIKTPADLVAFLTRYVRDWEIPGVNAMINSAKERAACYKRRRRRWELSWKIAAVIAVVIIMITMSTTQQQPAVGQTTISQSATVTTQQPLAPIHQPVSDKEQQSSSTVVYATLIGLAAIVVLGTTIWYQSRRRSDDRYEAILEGGEQS